MPGVSILEELHSVCGAGLGGALVDADAAARVAASLNVDDVRAAAAAVFPVKFESLEDEVTFLAVYRLLDFGSEYDAPLLASVRRDARETMQFGALGLHLGAKRLDRHFLKEFSLFAVTNYFSFEPRVDEELHPGITISKPGPLQPLAEAVRAVLNNAGVALEKLGQRTFGQHILALLDSRKDAEEPPLAAALVADLAGSFPGFDDVGSCGEARVPFHRKAHELASDLHTRFGGAQGAAAAADERFTFEDAHRLAGDSGAAAAAAWRALGVALLPERIAAAIDAEEPLGALDECAVRASAVAAADAVAAAVAATGGGGGGGVTAAQLGAWAASLVEEGGQLAGKAKLHRTKGTVAY